MRLRAAYRELFRLKSLCATVSHASGEQAAPMGSPRFFRVETSQWPAMPWPTLDSRIADIPSPSTSARIAGRPCTGSPVVNRKWWRSPWVPSPIRRSRRLLKPSMPNTGIDGSEPASKLEGLSSRCGLGEFRYRGRQFVHVVNDQWRSALLQTSPVLRTAMTSTEKADCGHAGGDGGVDTCGAILDDETAVRRLVRRRAA